jgi:hypothetical protein
MSDQSFGETIHRVHDNRPWHVIDKHTGGHDRNQQSPLTQILLSDDNITKLQYAIRMLVWKKTKVGGSPLDIGLQNRASIYNELYAWYKNYKYSRVDYAPEQIMPMVAKINYAFVTQVLWPNVVNTITDKELYNEWALKVPEPMEYGVSDNNVNKSVSLEGYYDDSIGSSGFSKSTWDWRKDGMYDEPESIHTRYPAESRRQNNLQKSTRQKQKNKPQDTVRMDSRFF